MKNIKFSRLFAAMMVVACLALAGCSQPEDETKVKEVTIYGTWEDDYTGYNTYGKYDSKITYDYIETASYGKQEGPLYVKMISENAGYIYYQFSTNVTVYGPAPDYETSIVNSKGKWGAVAFKDLTDKSVKMCDFADPSKEFPTTLEECISKYTVEKNYFTYMPEWTKK